MKLLTVLLLPSLAVYPALAHAKSPRKTGSGEALPPKWSGLIQPVKITADANLRSRLISTELGGKEIDFFNRAVEAGRVQLWLCEAAKAHGENERVRAAGDALEGTQAKENTYLARLAATKGFALENVSTPLPQKKVAAELGQLKGAKFDQAIMDQIVAAAETTVASYQEATQSADPEIKSLAERLLPIAKDKVMLANAVAGRGTDAPENRPKLRGAQVAPREVGEEKPAPAPNASNAPVVKADTTGAPKVPQRPEGPKPVSQSAPPVIAAPPSDKKVGAPVTQVAPAAVPGAK